MDKIEQRIIDFDNMDKYEQDFKDINKVPIIDRQIDGYGQIHGQINRWNDRQIIRQLDR